MLTGAAAAFFLLDDALGVLVAKDADFVERLTEEDFDDDLGELDLVAYSKGE